MVEEEAYQLGEFTSPTAIVFVLGVAPQLLFTNPRVKSLIAFFHSSTFLYIHVQILFSIRAFIIVHVLVIVVIVIVVVTVIIIVVAVTVLVLLADDDMPWRHRDGLH